MFNSEQASTYFISAPEEFFVLEMYIRPIIVLLIKAAIIILKKVVNKKDGK